MSSTLTKASVVGGAVIYLFAHFGASGKDEILLSTLGILFFCIFTLFSFIPAVILNFIWRRMSVSRRSALAFPVAIFLTAGGCVFLATIGRNDFSRAAVVSSVFGTWLASISAALTCMSLAESTDGEELA